MRQAAVIVALAVATMAIKIQTASTPAEDMALTKARLRDWDDRITKNSVAKEKIEHAKTIRL